LFNVRPSEPPRTQVQWLSHKKCYRDAQFTRPLQTPGRNTRVNGPSEYHEQYVSKESALRDPVLVREDLARTERRRVYAGANQPLDTDAKKEGIRGYPTIRSSSMPWEARYPESNNDAISHTGVRATYNRESRGEPTRAGGLRSSPYCDKFVSNVF